MVRSARPRCLRASKDSRTRGERTMPKQGTSARRARRSGSRAPKRSGLIANAETLKRSVRTKSALDNRSHRTIALIERPSSAARRPGQGENVLNWLAASSAATHVGLQDGRGSPGHEPSDRCMRLGRAWAGAWAAPPGGGRGSGGEGCPRSGRRSGAPVHRSGASRPAGLIRYGQ